MCFECSSNLKGHLHKLRQALKRSFDFATLSTKPVQHLLFTERHEAAFQLLNSN